MPSKIEWCEETWNFLGGCSPCSPGCTNCAAARQAASRLKNHPLYKGLTKNGKWTGEVRLCNEINRSDILEKPLHWKKPRVIFPCFMGDLFHEKVPFEFIDKIMFTIYRSYKLGHRFLILTKRPDRMLEYFKRSVDARILALFRKKVPGTTSRHRLTSSITDLVHLGVSISNQAEANEKIPILLQIPAAVRWLSIEPMLGPIELRCVIVGPRRRCVYDCLRGCAASESGVIYDPVCGKINGVILGGESGPGARPMHPDWVRNIRDQCVAAGVPFFFKQWGKYLHESQGANTDGPINAGRNSKKGYLWPDGTWSIRVGKKKAGRLLDGKIWDQLPA